jgi:hypothetical protein
VLAAGEGVVLVAPDGALGPGVPLGASSPSGAAEPEVELHAPSASTRVERAAMERCLTVYLEAG